MALTVQQIRPVAHVPLVLGTLRRLEVATVIDSLIALMCQHFSRQKISLVFQVCSSSSGAREPCAAWHRWR